MAFESGGYLIRSILFLYYISPDTFRRKFSQNISNSFCFQDTDYYKRSLKYNIIESLVQQIIDKDSPMLLYPIIIKMLYCVYCEHVRLTDQEHIVSHFWSK